MNRKEPPTRYDKQSAVDIGLGHEKLKAYQLALAHYSWMMQVMTSINSSAIVLDHWSRAAGSILENIANGNSRRMRSDRNRFFDVAIGSALECAGCLDIVIRRDLINEEQFKAGKSILKPVVGMTIGLRESTGQILREEREHYPAGPPDVYFAHEKLDVYQVALDMITWYHRLCATGELPSAVLTRLDKGTTSLVLNIAEGNGRFSASDQSRFLYIAHTSAMNVAAGIDILAVRNCVGPIEINTGKQLLARVVPMLFGLRRALGKQSESLS